MVNSVHSDQVDLKLAAFMFVFVFLGVAIWFVGVEADNLPSAAGGCGSGGAATIACGRGGRITTGLPPAEECR